MVPIDRSERQREFETLKTYGGIAPPKALALTPAGFFAIVAPGQRSCGDRGRCRADRAATLRADQRRRLHPVRPRQCRGRASSHRGQAPFHPMLLLRSGTLDPATAPFIRDDQRPEIARYLTLPEPKALALSPGHAGHRHRRRRHDRGCPAGCGANAAKRGSGIVWIYAEGDRIVLGWP
ncbi:MAG: hypothetical protein WDN69_18610 [Aliidongia sp.]